MPRYLPSKLQHRHKPDILAALAHPHLSGVSPERAAACPTRT